MFQLIVRKRKFDGHIKSEWESDKLPSLVEDWLVVLHHPERHRKSTGGIIESESLLFLHCFSTVQPLVVLLEYDLCGRFRGAKCDAALPATVEGQVIDFIDLDLDVIVEPDLSSFVRDEDTFARNRERMGYPEVVVQQARAGIALAQTLVASRRFPFEARLVPLLDAAVRRSSE
ncbi:MAG: DUF402 domain-containing protein [Ardenticatenales bacterium]|nr:DUF402 domain-containing protein [Ardenticatenales bacterium]